MNKFCIPRNVFLVVFCTAFSIPFMFVGLGSMMMTSNIYWILILIYIFFFGVANIVCAVSMVLKPSKMVLNYITAGSIITGVIIIWPQLSLYNFSINKLIVTFTWCVAIMLNWFVFWYFANNTVKISES